MLQSFNDFSSLFLIFRCRSKTFKPIDDKISTECYGERTDYVDRKKVDANETIERERARLSEPAHTLCSVHTYSEQTTKSSPIYKYNEKTNCFDRIEAASFVLLFLFVFVLFLSLTSTSVKATRI